MIYDIICAMKEKTINGTTGPKIRVDSWAAKLTPDQQWKLYDKARQSNVWTEAVDWAKEEFHLDLSPSRSAFFSWMVAMRKLESERRIEEISVAAAEAVALAKKTPRDKALFATFKMLAVEAAIAGNTKAASTYIQLAETIQTLYYKKLFYDRQEAEQKAHDAALLEVRDKDRQSILLNMAQKYGKSIPETVEEYRDRETFFKMHTDRMFAPL